MTNERRDSLAPSVYYDSPNFPGSSELAEWSSLRISPYDAETIIINSIAERRELTPAQLELLTNISIGREDVDLLAELRKLEVDTEDR